jgi:hypothetical protein
VYEFPSLLPSGGVMATLATLSSLDQTNASGCGFPACFHVSMLKNSVHSGDRPSTGDFHPAAFLYCVKSRFELLSCCRMVEVQARRSRSSWPIQSVLVSCAGLQHQGSPIVRSQTGARLDTCSQKQRVLLATPLCLRVLLEKCRSIAAMPLPCPILSPEVRIQEAPNKN